MAEIKFLNGIDDAEVLERIAQHINTYGDAISYILPQHQTAIRDIAEEHEHGVYLQKLNDFMVHLYTSGEFDFYEAFMCTRAMAENAVIPQMPLYSVFREFIDAVGPTARSIQVLLAKRK